jgi:hypothetical protein
MKEEEANLRKKKVFLEVKVEEIILVEQDMVVLANKDQDPKEVRDKVEKWVVEKEDHSLKRNCWILYRS